MAQRGRRAHEHDTRLAAPRRPNASVRPRPQSTRSPPTAVKNTATSCRGPRLVELTGAAASRDASPLSAPWRSPWCQAPPDEQEHDGYRGPVVTDHPVVRADTERESRPDGPVRVPLSSACLRPLGEPGLSGRSVEGIARYLERSCVNAAGVEAAAASELPVYRADVEG